MSQIISVDIDENFPVAGQDNDSQGFRDNFSVIKNSLATAKAEISELDELTAKKDRDNDFDGGRGKSRVQVHAGTTGMSSNPFCATLAFRVNAPHAQSRPPRNFKNVGNARLFPPLSSRSLPKIVSDGLSRNPLFDNA